MQCSNRILMHLEKEYFLCTAQNTVSCNHTFLHILPPGFPGYLCLCAIALCILNVFVFESKSVCTVLYFKVF